MDSNKPEMIKFVCVSDTHNRAEEVQLPEGDVLIHCGDFTRSGTPNEVTAFNEWINKQPHPIKIVIAGNHDLTFDVERYEKEFRTRFHIKQKDKFDAQKTKDILQGVHYLENASMMVHGYKVYGSPYTPDYHGWAFMYNKKDASKVWEQIPDDTDILLTHGPPFDVLDKTNIGAQAGCVGLRKEVLQRVEPRYHIFGHIHEGYGKKKIGNTTFINASSCTVKYKPTNKPIVFELKKKEQKAPEKAEEQGQEEQKISVENQGMEKKVEETIQEKSIEQNDEKIGGVEQQQIQQKEGNIDSLKENESEEQNQENNNVL